MIHSIFPVKGLKNEKVMLVRNTDKAHGKIEQLGLEISACNIQTPLLYLTNIAQVNQSA